MGQFVKHEHHIGLIRDLNFRASEEYWFHTSEQMALVGQHCPDIRHVMFMYQSEVCQLSYLAAFEHLVTLDIWGGSFYIDGFIELIEVNGQFAIFLMQARCNTTL